MRNHSNENDFDLLENGREGGTHFHMNDFARRLVLKERQRVTRKWPILLKFSCCLPKKKRRYVVIQEGFFKKVFFVEIFDFYIVFFVC